MKHHTLAIQVFHFWDLNFLTTLLGSIDTNLFILGCLTAPGDYVYELWLWAREDLDHFDDHSQMSPPNHYMLHCTVNCLAASLIILHLRLSYFRPNAALWSLFKRSTILTFVVSSRKKFATLSCLWVSQHKLNNWKAVCDTADTVVDCESQSIQLRDHL